MLSANNVPRSFKSRQQLDMIHDIRLVPRHETFKYCKPLASIDGIHLYGQYEGVLLLAIA
ncbi:hypothetical protein Ahy_A09g043871 [Arachis hypogaea]|uniref:Uncharacterized protein n=1 Tax=Arachis hypogaea TaxID=3818 RepID=A0A445BJ55_ARAHY|nr:hypothetical protein Ahy_A09g043871 [Arachis hypogaea]